MSTKTKLRSYDYGPKRMFFVSIMVLMAFCIAAGLLCTLYPQVLP